MTTNPGDVGGPATTGDRGSAIGMAIIGLALAGMLVVVAVDAGGYLLAASRAQALADSAALSAASAHHEGRSAERAVRRVLAAADEGELIDCACHRLPVAVRIAVDVHGLVVPRLTATRVVATSQATMSDP